MKAINTGIVYELFDDSLKTYDKLPLQSYVVRCSKHKGFFLEKYAEMDIKEEKIYGVHMEKVTKVLNSFENTNRNLGVILSGDKGIGKSLFAKLLAIEGMKRGLPLVIVDTYYPGIASYIESIEQEVMVLFDEFDKTFGDVKQNDGDASPQTHLLSLFDGVASGKKLFVITCNELRKLNDYLVNRPGRFHYHFRFEYPSAKEIKDYMMDKIPSDKYGEIDDIISFSRKINLNYDCLRAIAFEITMGLTFKEAISDLNIINIEEEKYYVLLRYKNGMSLSNKRVYLDLFSKDEDEMIYLYDKNGDYVADIEFCINDCTYDPVSFTNVIKGENIKINYTSDDSCAELIAKLKESDIDCLTITRVREKNIHYAV